MLMFIPNNMPHLYKISFIPKFIELLKVSLAEKIEVYYIVQYVHSLKPLIYYMDYQYF